MSRLTAEATHWLRHHRGTITNQALADAGISTTQRERLVRNRILRRVIVGVYQFAGTDLDEAGRCTALCAGRADMVVSGPTVSVVLMTRHLGNTALASMVDDAIAKKYCTDAALRRTAERLAGPGREWVRRFLRVLDRRHPGRPGASDPERDVYDALCDRGVEGLVRQWPQILPVYGPAAFDIALPDLRWALEVDVHPEHRTLEGAARDNRRDDAADAVGIAVKRIGEAQLDDDFEGTIDMVVAAIERRRSAVAQRGVPRARRRTAR